LLVECLLFVVSFQNLDYDPSFEEMNEVKVCLSEEIPHALVDDIPYFVMFFDEENLDTAVRVSWCESRGKDSAYRSDNNDSGLFQFIPRTWAWMVELHGIPDWDEWVITRFGLPYLSQQTHKTDFGFEFKEAQFTPYWNVKAAAHLAEDTYSNVTWADWNSSKWCWGDPKKWRKRWKQEQD